MAVPYSMWDPSLPTRNRTCTPAEEALSPNHWTPRDVPQEVPSRSVAWVHLKATVTWVSSYKRHAHAARWMPCALTHHSGLVASSCSSRKTDRPGTGSPGHRKSQALGQQVRKVRSVAPWQPLLFTWPSWPPCL